MIQKDITGGIRGEGLRFPLHFSFLLFILFIANYLMPPHFDKGLREATALGSVTFAKTIGLEVFLEPGSIISIDGMRLAIISECTAMSYMLIFAAAVIAYPASLKKKYYGLLFGISAIFLLNFSRIIFMGWLGAHYPAYFKFAHDYLWESGFLIAVLLIWITWVNSRFLVSGFRFSEGLKTKNLKLKTAFLAASIVIAYLFSGAYLRFLADASNWFIHAVNLNGGLVRSDGKGVFLIFWGQRPKELSTGIHYLLLYALLTLLFSKGDAKGMVFRITAGILALTLIQIATIVLLYAAMGRHAASWQITAIDAVTVASLIIVFSLQFLDKVFSFRFSVFSLRRSSTENMKLETKNCF